MILQFGLHKNGLKNFLRISKQKETFIGMCLFFNGFSQIFHVLVSNHTTQEEADHVIIEGMVRLLFLVLKHVPRALTFTNTHVNNFFEVGSARS